MKGPRKDGGDSSSEDGDLFKDKYKLDKPKKNAVEHEFVSDKECSDHDSRDDAGAEEDEESEDEGQDMTSCPALDDKEPRRGDSKDTEDAEKQKLDLLDEDLVTLLTKNCAKPLVQI